MLIEQLRVWARRSSIISIAPTAEIGSRFLRTVLLSRLLAPDEFGAAVAITVTLGISTLITDVAIDKFSMVEADFDSQETLGAAHTLSVIRGVAVALMLALSARFAATLFGAPQFSNSFALAALVPFIGSLTHLGIKQVQRHFTYAPDTLATVASNIAGIAALLASLLIIRD